MTPHQAMPLHQAMTPRQAFLSACALDVAVRKPGNVCADTPGHGMTAAQFITSAEVAADALCAPGHGVGQRIEAAVLATRAAVGCNTNLGILLLCAPIAFAAEAVAAERCAARPDASQDTAGLRSRLASVLAGLSVADAAAAYRAIRAAQPGGLGSAPSQDVQAPPSIDLRSAMALAADRDRIARQYRDGFTELFDLALPALQAGPAWQSPALGGRPDASTVAAVQALYLLWLASAPDSHIVRKHGGAVAQVVMRAAQGWQHRRAAQAGDPRRAAPPTLDSDPAFIAWDSALKAAAINPGTSADLTVATLMLALLLPGPSAAASACARRPGWHGS